MIFFKNENTEKEGLSLVENGCEQIYACAFSACDNPVCTCRTIDLDLTPVMDQTSGDLPRPGHRVEIDLEERTLCTSPKKNVLPGEKEFGDLLLSRMGEDDFNFLELKHFGYKNKIAETADINEIEGFFDYEEVERDGLMYAYNNVLPKCKYTVVTMDLMPAGEGFVNKFFGALHKKSSHDCDRY